jgi:hypothetical protein
MKSNLIEERVCVNEQVIPFKGKHSLKLYLQKKQKSGVTKYLHFVILLMLF